MHSYPERQLNHNVLPLIFGKSSAGYFGRICCCLLVLLASGCASYGLPQNKPIAPDSTAPKYSLRTWTESKSSGDVVFILAFSGGGTRAAAMAYGVLQELRDTPIVIGGEQKRLLDEVDHISSVSGGSFTAAYYGLYGDQLFEDFEAEFLRKDIESHLTKSLFRPIHWFSRKGRTERAIDYYNKILFHDATYADMMHLDRPMIVINASDLAVGVRFSFIQGYFDMLCSDIRTLQVARAVAASSAVPVVFNPVVIENFAGCEGLQESATANAMAERSQEFAEMYAGLQSYADKENRKYIHFVDGGITDNMGLRAINDIVQLSGGPQALLDRTGRKTLPQKVVLISVNASTDQATDMDRTTKQPSMMAAMNAMTDVQLHRYNAATVDKANSDLHKWSSAMSTPEHPITPYFIQVSFQEVPQPQLKMFLNKIPTSFSLTNEEVDTLIDSARTLLRADPKFQQLLHDLGAGGSP